MSTLVRLLAIGGLVPSPYFKFLPTIIMMTFIQVSGDTATYGLPVLITNAGDIAAGDDNVIEMADTSLFNVGTRVELNSDAGVEFALVTAVVENTSITVLRTELAIDCTGPMMPPFVRAVSNLVPGMYVTLNSLNDPEWTYRVVLYGHVLNGKTVSQLLTNTQKTYLEAKLVAYTTYIDLVLMP